MTALPALTPTVAELAAADRQAAELAAAAPAMAAARCHLERAYVELAAAVTRWGCWADEVAAGEEKNVGLGIEVGGLNVGDSPLYDAALDMGHPFTSPRSVVADALCQIHPPYADARRAGGLLAAVSAHLAETAKGGRL